MTSHDNCTSDDMVIVDEITRIALCHMTRLRAVARGSDVVHRCDNGLRCDDINYS